VKAIRRVGYDCMDTIVLLTFEPIETISMEQHGFTDDDRLFPLLNIWEVTLHAALKPGLDSIKAALLSDKKVGRIKAQV
jgi:hypothetical protein